MAFTVTKTSTSFVGTEYLIAGTYVNDGGSTGGTILTPVDSVMSVIFGPLNSSVYPTATILSNGDVSIVTPADQSGTFTIIGN